MHYLVGSKWRNRKTDILYQVVGVEYNPLADAETILFRLAVNANAHVWQKSSKEFMEKYCEETL